MSIDNELFEELSELVVACTNGTASDEQFARLEQLLDTSEEARSFYVDSLDMHATLYGYCRPHQQKMKGDLGDARFGVNNGARHGPSDDEFSIRNSAVSDHSSVPPTPLPSILGCPIGGPVGYLTSGWPVAYLVAAVVLGIGLLIGGVTHVSQPLPVATQTPSTKAVKTTPETQMHFVGRITGMVDCQWAGSLPSPASGRGAGGEGSLHLQSPVHLHDRFALSSGLMEITYNTGARVILQGPCTYEVESPTGGYLSLGKVTAKLERKEERRTKNEERSGSNSSFLIPHSYFAIRTPTATVTDLGTEFGVEVSEGGETSSHVFQGSIELQAAQTSGEPASMPRVLHENESATVKKVGDNPIILLDSTPKLVGFVRTLPKTTIKTLDLVDVVAGGDGFSDRRDRGIDPTTGQVADKPQTNVKTDAELPVGDGKYHRVEAIPFVDGVFIPDGRRGPVQVDSAGHTFAECPETSNQSGGHIWAGAEAVTDLPPPVRVGTELGGIDFASPGHGPLFLFANKGITFDLDAIRRANPNQRPVRFRAVAGNTEPVSADIASRPVYADVWVLVDGRVRFRRREINSCSGAIPVIVPIGENDHFLTLAATDGGNGTRWDWVMFGDPQLDLSTEAVSTQNTSGH